MGSRVTQSDQQATVIARVAVRMSEKVNRKSAQFFLKWPQVPQNYAKQHNPKTSFKIFL